MNELQTVEAGSVEAVRTPEIIGAEIRTLTQQGRCITLLYSIEIGRRLKEAKALLEHGEWLPFLERETDFSSSSAARYMKVYEEYGSAQISIFGETNFPTLGNLSVSKALQLLAVPAEEREEFAEANDVEHISARELEKLLKEKAEAQEEAARVREELDREREDAEGAAMELDRLREENRELKARPVTVMKERDEEAIEEAAQAARENEASLWQDRLSSAERELERAKAETDRERQNTEKAREEAARVAKAKEAAEWAAKMTEAQKKLDKAKAKTEKYKAEAEKAAGSAKEQLDAARKEAEEKAAAAEREAAQIREELERARKELSLASPEATAFKLRFAQIQEDFQQLFQTLEQLGAGSELGQKLTKALGALLEQMAGQLKELGIKNEE